MMLDLLKRSVSVSSLLATIVLSLSACEKTDLTASGNGVPGADPANNVCVVSKHLTPNAFDELSDVCNNRSYIPSTRISSELNDMINALTRGTTGAIYNVLDSGSKVTSSFTCGSSGVSYADAADIWVKYSCVGTSVEAKIYGPYPRSALQIKIDEISYDLGHQGYSIAYVSQDAVTQDANIFYLTFFVYRNNPTDVHQKNFVNALQNAKTFNKYTFQGEHHSLSDTLNKALMLDPSLANREDVKAARDMLDLLERIRK